MKTAKPAQGSWRKPARSAETGHNDRPLATSVGFILVIGAPVVGPWLLDVSWAFTPAIAAAAFAGGMLVVKGLTGARTVGNCRRASRVSLSSWVLLAGIALAAGAAWSATEWLLAAAENAKDPAAARIDAVKTGVGIGAGIGGVLALILAIRRQLHQEVTAADNTHDATERRVTELYTKAGEQLGSDKAPVRLAGLYALERLAQGAPDQRETIVKLLCAYLRMPYTIPGDQPDDSDKSQLDLHREHLQENEVRLAAQRILAQHLRPENNPAEPPETFWPNLDIDLTGATLVNFDLSGCSVRSATFTGARFAGPAHFGRTTFSGPAVFSRTSFTDSAAFHLATFSDFTTFAMANFDADASFLWTTFAGGAQFYLASFTGIASFSRTTFIATAEFCEAVFAFEASFDSADFSDKAEFAGAVFLDDPRWTSFTDAKFGQCVPSEVERFLLPPQAPPKHP